MKKLIITVGLLLVAAVFMSGCVTETEDPIVGIWHSDKEASLPNGDFDSRIFVFNAWECLSAYNLYPLYGPARNYNALWYALKHPTF